MLKKNFLRLILIIMASVLLFASGCEDSKRDNSSENKIAASESTSPLPEKSSESIAGASGDEKIDFITQEYTGENIVEIPYIKYSGGTNPEIEAINRSFNQGYQVVYEDFFNNKLEQEWIEIRSYPFTTDNYLQIVITNCVYPNYGTDGDIASVNYDRKAKKWLTVEDAMQKMGLTEDDVLFGVGENFTPETKGELIDNVRIAGFLIKDAPDGEMTQLLLNITFVNPNADEPRQSFYSYMPDGNDLTNDLTQLGNQCLFDPYDMDQMIPPLSYQKNLSEGPADHEENEQLATEAENEVVEEAENTNHNYMWITVPEITENGVLIESHENDAGVRADTYLYDDIVRIAIERLPPGEYGATSVIARTSEWENIPESELDAQEGTLGSYPSFQLAYEKNGNWYMDLIVQTDSWDFRIHTEMPVDIPGMDEDEEYMFVEQTVILWFYTAEIIDGFSAE